MKAQEPTLKEEFVNIIKLFQIHRLNSKFTVTQPFGMLMLKRPMTFLNIRNSLVDEYYRTLWLIFEESYFRSIQPQDLQILTYLKYLFQHQFQEKHQEEIQNQFQSDIATVFIPEYIDNNQQWIEEAKNIWKAQKTIVLQTKELTKTYKHSIGLGIDQKHTNQRKKDSQIKLNDPFTTEIDIELAELIKQQSSISQQMKTIVDPLIHSVMDTIQNEKELYFQVINTPIHCPTSKSRSLHQKITDQLECFKHLILKLEEKQISQSLFKITNIVETEKEGAQEYTVCCEPALHLPPLKLSEEQLIRHNSLREVQLFNYYFVGWKSKLNYVSHNIYGFMELLQENRTKLVPEKTLAEMKQLKNYKFTLHEVTTFNSMEMCHQCKCMFDPKYLVKCQFQTTMQARPLSLLAFDSYTEQIIHSKISCRSPVEVRNQHRRRLSGMMHLKSGYLTYRHEKGRCYCDRYYCKMCLKAYDSRKNKSICPFCQGICQCSRCFRNDFLFKIKSLYILLGGNLDQLQKISLFETLLTKNSHAKHNKGKEKQIVNIRYARREYLGMRLLTYKIKKRQNLKLRVCNSRNDILKECLKSFGFALNSRK